MWAFASSHYSVTIPVTKVTIVFSKEMFDTKVKETEPRHNSFDFYMAFVRCMILCYSFIITIHFLELVCFEGIHLIHSDNSFLSCILF